MEKVLTSVVITVIFTGVYILDYSCFDTCLSDDVEFNYGKHKKRKIYKETHGFWRKFFFIDIRKMVSRWHYVLFIVNFTVFVLQLILINVYVLSGESVFRWLFLICCGVYILSSVPAVFARWALYRGNVVRSRKKYRKNNRK